MIPIAVEPLKQICSRDCGLACIRMLSQAHPDEVHAAAFRASPKLYQRGMYGSELIRIAKALGMTMQRRDEWTDDDIGVLDVRWRRRDGGRHFAVFFQGVIIDPYDGMVWDTEVYLSTKRGRAVALYVLTDTKAKAAA